MSFTFKKEERICSKIIIDTLFDRSSKENLSLMIFPFKVIYKIASSETNVKNSQILISVSKRNFKKAVDRNLLKRRIREAYRLNKKELESENNFLIAFIFVGKGILDYSQIETSMISCLKKINKSKFPDKTTNKTAS